MNALSRRRPFFKSLLLAGSIILALWCYALATDTLLILPSRSHRARVVKKSENPAEYRGSMQYFGSVAVIFVFIALVRINPIEDRLVAWKKRIEEKAKTSGATTKPAPIWAYIFLAAFVGFIAYLGYIFMYKE